MVEARDFFGGPDAEVDVVLRPRAEYSAADVVERLEAAGASRTDVVTPSHVSARVRRGELAALESVATVTLKTAHRFLGGGGPGRLPDH